MKKILRVTGRFLLLLLSLMIVVLLVLQIPQVQTFLGHKATAFLEKKTGGTLYIGQIDINFINRVSLKNVLVKGPGNDTVLSAGKLKVGISLFALLNKKVIVKQVELDNTVFNITQSKTDNAFNFQFIIDAFASKDTTPKPEKKSKPWSISIDKVTLNNVRGLIDLPKSIRLDMNIGHLLVNADKVEIIKKIVRANNLELDNTNVNLALYAREGMDTVTRPDTSLSNLLSDFYLPDIGWDFEAGKITFTNVGFSLTDLGKKPIEYGFDPLDMNITHINFGIEKASYVGQTIKAEIKNLAAEDKSGIKIKQLKASVKLDPCGMLLENFMLETGGSELAGITKLEYDDYNDLLRFSKGLSVTSNLTGHVAVDELTKLIPSLVNDSIFTKNTNGQVKLDWKIKGDITALKAERMNISLGNATVINATFSSKGLPDLKKARFDINLINVSTTYADADKYLNRLKLPKSLAWLGIIKVSGHVQGALNDLTLNNLLISSIGAKVFEGNGRITGLPGIDSTNFTINIKQLNVLPSILMLAFGQDMPDEIKRLGAIGYSGTYNGTIYDMALKGTLVTNIGSLDADLRANFEHDYSNVAYQGNLQLKQFDVGRLLADEDIGTVSLLANIDGQGLSLDKLNGKVGAIVQQAVYKGYDYKTLLFNGTVNKKEFNGHASIADSNLKFTFDGLVNFNDSVPRFRFAALLDTINTGRLNLMANNYGIHTAIDVDFQGLSLDHFLGHAVLKDIRLSNDSLSYQMDSLSVRGRMEEGRRKGIRITSPILNARVRGEMKLSQLPGALTSYVEHHFSIDKTIKNTGQTDTFAQQDITFQATLRQPLNLIRIFVPKLARFDTASITGQYNSRQQTMAVKAYLPGITYDSISIDSIRLNVKGDKDNFDFALNMDSVDYGSQMRIPYIHFNGDLDKGGLNMGLAIAGDSTVERLFMAGKLTRGTEKDFIFSLKDSFYLNGSRWKVPADNLVDFGGGKLYVKDLILKKAEQQISVASAGDSAKAPPLNVRFRKFNIRELSDLLGFTTYQVDGVIDGGITLQKPMANMAFTADMAFNNLAINKEPAGNLTLKAAQQDSIYTVALALEGSDNDLTAEGTIANDFKSLSVSLKMPELKLRLIEPFLKGNISDSKGYLSADVKVNGKLSAPEVIGALKLHGISTLVKELNTNLTLADNEISISPTIIKFPRLKVTDEKQRTATLSGVINHDHFKNINFDLTFNTPGFGFMNTTESQNNFYYGTVVMSMSAKINGTPKLPVLDVTAKTLKGTKFYISPSRIQSGTEQANFVIFHSPRVAGKKDTFVMAKNNYEVQSSGIDLTVNFEMTPDAELQVVIDPTTGDKLVCHGSATIGLQLPPIGVPQVTGTYTIDTGSYSFSYQKLLKRDFYLQKGGHIDFSGDPMEANLDITAVYNTMTTTYELISGEAASLNSQDIETARRRSKIQVLLNIRGQILEPEITFDIQLPVDQSDIAQSIVARQLALIKQDETELDKQVFGLLVFNSFFADQGGAGGNDAASTGTNLALSGVNSVGGLINSQLNKLASKVEGLEINLNVGSYVSNAQTNTNTNAIPSSSVMTEAQLAISKHFLNDRLVVSLGGNLDLENVTSGQNTAGGGTGSNSFSNAGGDFTLEYKLTPNGRYRVKVFQSTNYDILQGQLYKTGVGFTFQRSFSTLRKKKKNGKPVKDTNKEPPADTSPN